MRHAFGMLAGILLLLPTAWTTGPETAAPRQGGVATYTPSFQPADSLPVTIDPPSSYRGQFGGQITSVPDVDGDGTPDLLVSAQDAGPEDPMHEGRVYTYSGRTGRLIDSLAYPDAQYPDSLSHEFNFGYRMARVGDLDGDGTDDVVVGEPRRKINGSTTGQAYLFDGATGTAVRTIPSPSPERRLGFGASLASVGDLDGDDASDLFVGAYRHRGPEALDGFLFSGADGRALRVDPLLTSYGPPVSVGPIGDLNGDDTPDLLFEGPSGIRIVSGDAIRAPLSPSATADERPSEVHRYPVEQNGSWGYIDASGELVIAPRFEAASPFSDGWARITVDGRPAFIDSTGSVMLRPDVSTVRSFSEGLAAASPTDTPLWGYIDTTGAFAIDPQFLRAYRFSNGRAAVEKNGAFGYVNRDGEMVIAPQYENARRFGNGRAPVLVEQTMDEAWGYVNRDGTMVIEPQYTSALPFSQGRAPVNTSDDRLDGDYHYIDPAGTVAFEAPSFPFGGALVFSNGFAPVKGGFDDRWGYVNRDGETVIDYEYVFAEPFHGPLARVATSYRDGIRVSYQGPLTHEVKGAEWVYLNKNGEQVWP